MTAQKMTREITEIPPYTLVPLLILSLPSSLGIRNQFRFFICEDLIGSKKQAFSSLILDIKFTYYTIKIEMSRKKHKFLDVKERRDF
jgi:hypothetical protein